MSTASGTTPGWASYRDAIGDRSPMFAALADDWGVERALYPGCYLDAAPSTAIRSVTYLDVDRRGARYFGDANRVRAELRAAGGRADAEVAFLAADYTTPLPLDDGAFDLLISLYAGPVWERCRRFLRPGGLLLANTSHGDASLAALDPDLELVGVVPRATARVSTASLASHLIPKKPEAADADAIRASGRGIGYTRSAFAYLFRLRNDVG